MHILRTPDDRFANLAGYPFAPHYVDVPAGDGSTDTLRVHYIDEGPASAEPVLLLHGEPSWSYLYRTMIPVLVGAGYRCIAPDLVGFGRSDKPAARDDYTYARHIEWLRAALFDRLDLTGLTLVCQDWGGLLGLRLVGEHAHRFARVVAANTFLPTGDRPLGAAFEAWRDYSQQVAEFPVGMIVKRGCVSDIGADAIAAYDAPFPDERYKAGARQFPTLVPASPSDPAASANKSAWAALVAFDKPFLTAFSDSDPITRGADAVLQKLIAGAKGPAHVTIAAGGHFLQEDQGPRLAEVVAGFMRATPVR